MKRLTKLIVIVYLMTTVICPSFGFVREQGSLSYDVRLKKDELQAFERFQLIKADSDQEILIKAQKNQEELKIVSFLLPNNFPVYWWRSGKTDGDGYVQYLFKTPATPGDYPVKIEGKTNSGEIVAFDFVLHVIEPGTVKNQIAVWESKGRIEKLTVKLRDNNEIVFPKGFESEAKNNGFSIAGAIVGFSLTMAYLTSDQMNTKLGFNPLGGSLILFVGGAIGCGLGFLADEVAYHYNYYNTNLGWVGEDETGQGFGDIIYFDNNGKTYDQAGSKKVVGVIVPGQFRRVIETQHVDGQYWYKVKIEDRPIFE